MRRFAGLAAFLLIFTASVWSGAAVLQKGQDTSSAASGHGFLKNESKCDICHEVRWNGEVGNLETDKFDKFFVEVCASCHPENLVRSHPVNVSPYKLFTRESYPAELPLQYSGEKHGDVLTCVTCHKPHGDRLHWQKLYSRQKEFPDSGGLFLTYYLRKRGHLPREGYAPLCRMCHPNL